MSFSLVANWKNVLLPAQEQDLLLAAEELALQLPEGYSLTICPSFLSLDRGREICHAAHLGAQDLLEDETVCTGTQTGRQLSALGVETVCIGHAERQRRFHEDVDQIVRKVQMALVNGLQPLVCLSEQNAVPLLQTLFADKAILPSASSLLFAYEPNAAIGGRAPLASELEPIFASLRATSATYSASPRFLYGGGVDLSTLPDLLSLSQLDGFLLGRASQTASSLRGVVEAVVTHRSSSVVV